MNRVRMCVLRAREIATVEMADRNAHITHIAAKCGTASIYFPISWLFCFQRAPNSHLFFSCSIFLRVEMDLCHARINSTNERGMRTRELLFAGSFCCCSFTLNFAHTIRTNIVRTETQNNAQIFGILAYIACRLQISMNEWSVDVRVMRCTT